LLSRLTDFQPGYLYGLVYSVAFTQKLAKHQDGRLTALSSLVTLAVAVGAWVAWSRIHTQTATGLMALGLLLSTSILASVFVGGLVGSVFNLAPLRFLSGHKLFSWRKSVWALTFGLAFFLLLQVLLLPAQGGHSGNIPIIVTLGLFVVFGIFSVAFWWYFARRKAAAEKAAAATEAAKTKSSSTAESGTEAGAAQVESGSTTESGVESGVGFEVDTAPSVDSSPLA
jgi:hypothetical protein